MSEYWRDALRRLRRDRVALLAGGLATAFIVVAILAPWIAPYDPLKTSLSNRLRPPSPSYWLGQDEVGRDILSRIVWGSRISLSIGFLSVGFGFLVGGAIGVAAGFYRRLDNPLMRIIDIVQAFPFILRAIAVVAILGPGFVNLFIAIGFGRIPPFARLIRAEILRLRGETFVEAARAIGAGDARLLRRHVLPQVVAPLVTFATLEMGTSILGAASLSFLGLGVNPPTPEWGAIASAGREHLRAAPNIVIFPSIAIFLAVWSSNVLGDALRDALDPRLRGR